MTAALEAPIRRHNRRPPRRFLLRLGFVLVVWVLYFIGAVRFIAHWTVAPGPSFGLAALAVLLVWSLTGFLSRGYREQRKNAEAGRDTSLVLRPLVRSGWHVVDYTSFHDGDVGHVLVGPGGVFAVETAWLTEARGVIPGRRLHQAGQGAHRIEVLLRSQGVRTRVRPLLVAWGPQAPYLPDGLRTDQSVWLASGPQAADWLGRLFDERLELRTVEEAASAIEKFAALRRAARLAAA